MPRRSERNLGRRPATLSWNRNRPKEKKSLLDSKSKKEKLRYPSANEVGAAFLKPQRFRWESADLKGVCPMKKPTPEPQAE